MTTKYTQQDVADALTVFIKSGSASGNEAMRKYCLSRVKSFAEADRLRAVNAVLVEVVEFYATLNIAGSPELGNNARAALAKYKEGK